MDTNRAKEILEIEGDFDETSLRKAWLKMVKQYHPDGYHADGIGESDADDLLKEVNEAHDFLKEQLRLQKGTAEQTVDMDEFFRKVDEIFAQQERAEIAQKVAQGQSLYDDIMKGYEAAKPEEPEPEPEPEPEAIPVRDVESAGGTNEFSTTGTQKGKPKKARHIVRTVIIVILLLIFVPSIAECTYTTFFKDSGSGQASESPAEKPQAQPAQEQQPAASHEDSDLRIAQTGGVYNSSTGYYGVTLVNDSDYALRGAQIRVEFESKNGQSLGMQTIDCPALLPGQTTYVGAENHITQQSVISASVVPGSVQWTDDDQLNGTYFSEISATESTIDFVKNTATLHAFLRNSNPYSYSNGYEVRVAFLNASKQPMMVSTFTMSGELPARDFVQFDHDVPCPNDFATAGISVIPNL